MTQNFIKLRPPVLLRPLIAFYAYIDAPEYLADPLLAKNRVHIAFGREYVDPSGQYVCILVKMPRHEERRFLRTMRELENKMLLTGRTGYTKFCEQLQDTLARIERGNNEREESHVPVSD